MGSQKEQYMADLIVKAAVRNAIDDQNVAADFYEALDDEVQTLLADATRRAKEKRPHLWKFCYLTKPRLTS